MKKYSAFQIPFLSFYSKALYREVCFDGKGVGFAYVFMLLAVALIPSILTFQTMLTRFVRDSAPRIVSQIPQITFANGVANVEAPQPYTIMDPKTRRELVVIDTTGTINSLKETKALCLVTKTEAFFRKSDIETRSFNYKDLGHFVLNRGKVTTWLEIARTYAALALYPLILIASFVFKMFHLLICAALGAVLASRLQLKLPYDALLRLSAVAVTPGIIIKAILHNVGIRVPLAGVWFFLLAMMYLFIEVRECAKASGWSTNVNNTNDSQAQ